MTTHIVKRGLANVFARPCNFADINQPECSSQITLNHKVQVLGQEPGFFNVRMSDNYTGWVRESDLCLPADSFDLEERIVTALFADVFSGRQHDSEVILRLTLGTPVFVHSQADLSSAHDTGMFETGMLETVLPDGRTGFIDTSNIHDIITFATVTEPVQLAAEAALQAKRLVGAPYFWGGTTPLGIDCSGLVQLAYRMRGVALLRDACLQFEDPRFERLQESFEQGSFNAGDLLFFRGVKSEKITHVGIALGDDRFIHASPYSGESHVVIEKREGNRYAHRFIAGFRLKQFASTGLPESESV